MRAVQVIREFRDKVREPAHTARMPEVREGLEKLAEPDQTELEKLKSAPSIAPK